MLLHDFYQRRQSKGQPCPYSPPVWPVCSCPLEHPYFTEIGGRGHGGKMGGVAGIDCFVMAAPGGHGMSGCNIKTDPINYGRTDPREDLTSLLAMSPSHNVNADV